MPMTGDGAGGGTPVGGDGVPVPGDTVRRWHADLAWLPAGGVRSAVLIEAAGERFVSVRPDVRAGDVPAGTVHLPGLTLPGLANAHSHAFHRALRGVVQAGQGTFWTWRERMYQVAGRLQPDSYLALARAVYAEMALAGITCVGEFHYLHHDTGGARYADPNEMGRVLIEAAVQAGLRITLLDTCYLSGGLSPDGSPAELSDVQQRFSDGDGAGWAERAGQLGADEHGMLGATPAPGWRSTRSGRCRPDQMGPVVAWSHAYGAPLHAHLSEQPAENEASLAAHGLTPTRLLRPGPGRWGPAPTVVHASTSPGTTLRCSAGAGPWCACARPPRPILRTVSGRPARWPPRALR
jgi:formiminoglutamate deiminase